MKLRKPKSDECVWMVVLMDEDGSEADFFETEAAARESVENGDLWRAVWRRLDSLERTCPPVDEQRSHVEAHKELERRIVELERLVSLLVAARDRDARSQT